MCSVPPSGNGPSTMRVIRRSLKDALIITVGFVFKKVVTNEAICRQCFFGGNDNNDLEEDQENYQNGISDADLKRYQHYFAQDSKVTLDITDLSNVLPSKHVVVVDVDDTSDTSNDTRKAGQAPFAADLPPCFVMGATDDFIVDTVSNMETARYYGVDHPIYIDSYHDVMLGSKWKKGAHILHEWLEETF